MNLSTCKRNFFKPSTQICAQLTVKFITAIALKNNASVPTYIQATQSLSRKFKYQAE